MPACISYSVSVRDPMTPPDQQAAHPLVELRLSWVNDGEQVSRVFTDGEVSVGRDSRCDVWISGPSVSRGHATLTLESGRWSVTDQGSANGTWIDGKKVVQNALGHGMRISFGSEEVLCQLTGGSGSPSLPRASLEDLDDDLDAGLEATSGSVMSQLDVGDFDGLVERVLAGESDSTEGDPSLGQRRAATAISVVRSAIDTLLEQRPLDATLGVILDLVFAHLPCDRGVILLMDEDSKLIPAARKSRDEESGELRISSSIARKAVETRTALLVKDTGVDLDFMNLESIVNLNIQSAMCVPMCRKGRVVGLVYVDRTSVGAAFEEPDLELLSLLSGMSAAAVEQSQVREDFERERSLRERLSRYSAPNVVSHLLGSKGDGSAFAVDEREVTVLFADLAGFTTMSESLGAREVAAILNEVFEMLTAEVFREGGTLDKFIGDALMAFWGAPVAQLDHAQRAVRAGLAMQRRLAARNAAGVLPRIEMRIGINTGAAIVGDIGARERRDYTVVGDTVNVASRLESSVAAIGQVVVGPQTRAVLGEAFACAPLPEIRLKGRAAGCIPYRVIDRLSGKPA